MLNRIFVPYCVDIKSRPYQFYTVKNYKADYLKAWCFDGECKHPYSRNISLKKLWCLQDEFIGTEVIEGRNFQLMLNGEEKDENAIILDNTPSVFLGLYLTILHEIKGECFKGNWTSITVTGDIEIKDNKLELVSVSDSYKKFEDYKKDEYLSKYGGKQLFLYVEDYPDDRIKSEGNITVRHFTPRNNDGISKVIKCVFDPVPINNMDERQRNMYFTGREEKLKEISEGLKLQSSGGKVTLYGIPGPGIGKTQISLEFAHRCIASGEYSDAVWWVNAETIDSVNEYFLDFADKVGLIPEGKDEARKLSPAQLSERLARWFKDNKSWLFILDNVESIAAIEPYVSIMQTGHILITMRNLKLAQGKLIKIDVFKSNEAVSFIKKRFSNYFNTIDSEENIKKLVKRLKYLPLAIEQAAAFIICNRISCNAYLDLISEGLETLKSIEGELNQYKYTVFETFTLSLKMLSESAKQMINICAYMAPERIPLDFFQRQYKCLPVSLSEKAEVKTEFLNIVTELVNFSLVERINKNDGSFLNIHRLVQEICRELVKDNAKYWLNFCMDATIAELPSEDGFANQEQRKQFEKITASAVAIKDYAEKIFDDDLKKMEQLSRLYHGIGLGNYYSALYEKALELYKRALNIRENVLNRDHPDIAFSYNNIAVVYFRQGDYDKAIDQHLIALEIRKKILEKDHSDTALSYNNIALIYSTQGYYAKALKLNLKALEIREKKLSKEHLYTATTYNDIGLIHARLENYDEALEYYQKALQIYKKNDMQPWVASVYSNIAYIYLSKGNYTESLNWNNESFNIREKVFPKDHLYIADTYYIFAHIYSHQGNYEKALQSYQKALESRKKKLTKNHPHIADIYIYMAYICSFLCDFEKSVEYINKASSIYNDLHNNDYPSIAYKYDNIAIVYYELEDRENALKWFKKSLAIREEKLGKDDPETTASYNNISGIYSGKTKYKLSYGK